MLAPDRYFDPEPRQKRFAMELYESAANLPIISPHGHVDASLFDRADASFGNPTELIVIPDHYVFRMLYSQGVALEDLGIPRRSGARAVDPRQAWQVFAEHYYLFRGTPTGAWLAYEFEQVLGVEEKLTGENAQRVYDQISERLAAPDFTPRALYRRFNIEVLCTTDAASDPLTAHQSIRASGWGGQVRPTFRPDATATLDAPTWPAALAALSQAVGYEISSYARFIQALEERRAFFKSMGATATDHGVLAADTQPMSAAEAERVFQRALRGEAGAQDARRFTANLLFEMARMSVEDGLVMQIHAGSVRNHNRPVFDAFGPDKGSDIPTTSEFTQALRPLLAAFGNDPRLRVILFTLDETTYARELAPLAGHYPALRLGPPWWFHDSWNGMRRYFDQVMETAGIYNTAGFNDDTRAFLSIPARHDLWRRAAANWLGGLEARHVIDHADALEMMRALAYGLAKDAYRLSSESEGA